MRSMSVCCVLLAGCFGARGSGVPDEELREVGGFDEVRNTTSIEVNVVEGDAEEVFVRCDDNLLDLVRTEVAGGELRVTTRPNTWLRPQSECFVDVITPTLRGLSGSGSGRTTAVGPLPDLGSLSNSGSGRVLVEGLETQGLSIANSGSGGVEASGVGGFAELDNSGSGGIQAEDLSVDEADIRNSASGSVSLTVVEHASVRLSGSGNVRILGRPRVDADDSGSGTVVVD